MKKNLTELVFIMDRSGSMSGLEKDCVGGFNSMIKKQKKVDGECLVTTVLFNNSDIILHDRIDLKKIRQFKEEDYVPCGCTALIDALGNSINHISEVHRYIRKEDVPEHTIFVITTDGLENASKKYSSDEVKKMVEARKEEGWEFIFLAANIDAVETAKQYGIEEDKAVNYISDEIGTRKNYEVLGEALCSFRRKGAVADGWAEEIKEDYRSRS
ncbi:MAG: VWA domain-containing protein [Erysipelotrichaceae bacterium]|nr:VWA domain-containing protein [Erysipelotrichaceae bacterium]